MRYASGDSRYGGVRQRSRTSEASHSSLASRALGTRPRSGRSIDSEVKRSSSPKTSSIRHDSESRRRNDDRTQRSPVSVSVGGSRYGLGKRGLASQPFPRLHSNSEPCHHFGMSGDADELPGSAFSSTERGKARRLLLGISAFFLTVTLGSLSNRVPPGPLPLPLDTLILVLVIGSLILTRSRPQGSGRGGLRPPSAPVAAPPRGAAA